MSVHAHTILPHNSGPSWRHWLPAIIIVLLVHAGLVYWLVHRSDTETRAGAPEPVVMMDLPPMAVAQPQESVAEVAPGPQQTEAQPEEVEPPQETAIPDLPPAPKPEAVLVTAPKPQPKPPKKVVKQVPKPVVKKEREPPAPRTSAPPRQVAGARTAAAPAPGSAGSAAAASNWRSLVSAQLNRNKRYPDSAQGQQGTAAISFSVDRGGRVVSVRLIRSSGSSVLDQEAVAMAHRSSPFPPPPPDVGGGAINLTVPVSFHPR